MKYTLVIAFGFLFVSCSHKKNKVPPEPSKQSESKSGIVKSIKSVLDTVTIDCDSLYPHKAYTVRLITSKQYDVGTEGKNNALFQVDQIINGKSRVLVKDSVYSRTAELQFKDYNGDKVKDILVQNYSDVRSNWTYYLYLVDISNNKLHRIRGFEEIKNPRYLTKFNLIDNYVVSGTNWTDFYKIQGDTVKDFNMYIEENGHYKRDYAKALKVVLKKTKQ